MLWASREVDAPAEVLWDLLTDPARWPEWGPSVAAAELDGDRLRAGALGRVRTAVGVTVPVEVTAVEPGRRWAWRVAGIPATDHRVDPLGPGRCRVGIGVPAPAAPYLAVCHVALGRLERIATAG